MHTRMLRLLHETPSRCPIYRIQYLQISTHRNRLLTMTIQIGPLPRPVIFIPVKPPSISLPRNPYLQDKPINPLHQPTDPANNAKPTSPSSTHILTRDHVPPVLCLRPLHPPIPWRITALQSCRCYIEPTFVAPCRTCITCAVQPFTPDCPDLLSESQQLPLWQRRRGRSRGAAAQGADESYVQLSEPDGLDGGAVPYVRWHFERRGWWMYLVLFICLEIWSRVGMCLFGKGLGCYMLSICKILIRVFATGYISRTYGVMMMAVSAGCSNSSIW
jgi:hypothetical protein